MSWWSPERDLEQAAQLPNPDNIIREQEIWDALNRHQTPTLEEVRRILRKARSNALLEHTQTAPQDEFVQALDLEEAATLLNIPADNHELMNELYATALEIKQRIYGDRIVLFAPLYTSNWCTGSCLYCAYRGANLDMHRTSLTKEQLVAEAQALQRNGHKRIVMLCGEHPNYSFEQFVDDLLTVHSVKSEPHGEIRRINVEIPALSITDMKRLKATNAVGTITLFQETYHRETFRTMHPYGPKSPFNWRILNMDRAMMGKCDDVGLGALYGLFDYRYEVLGILQHAQHLDRTYGAGPHTISIPRIQPAAGSAASQRPPYYVDDANFKKLVAIIRICVPYTGMILSTRESPAMRHECIRMGISQMSAGSHTDVGSYAHMAASATGHPSAGPKPCHEVPVGAISNNVPPLAATKHIKQCCCPHCRPRTQAAPQATPAAADAAPASPAPATPAAPAAAAPAAPAPATQATGDIESMGHEPMPDLARWCDDDAKPSDAAAAPAPAAPAPAPAAPGAATERPADAASQFTVADTRTMLEVVKDMMRSGIIPSWCTACYRCQRTGAKFMAIAKKGLIQDFCQPNALLTLAEYLLDYADDEGRQLGWDLIAREQLKIKSDKRRQAFLEKLEELKGGARDRYF